MSHEKVNYNIDFTETLKTVKNIEIQANETQMFKSLNTFYIQRAQIFLDLNSLE